MAQATSNIPPRAGIAHLIEHSIASASGAAWRYEVRRVYAAEHDYNRAGMQRALVWDEGTPEEIAVADADNELAFRRLIAATDRQMLLPAPMREALRWKQRRQALDGGRDHWKVAIAADEARLGK